MRHHLAAGDHDAALDAIESLVQEMLGTSEASTLAGWVAEVPAERWAGRPALVPADATLLFGAGRFEEAFDAQEAAIEHFVPASEQERAALAIILAKIVLFDLANLQAMARALSFIAVGAALLADATLEARLCSRAREPRTG